MTITPFRTTISDKSGLPVTFGKLQDFPDDPVACLRALHAAHGGLAALQEGDTRLHFVFAPEWNQRVLSDDRTFHSRFFTIRGPRKSAQRRLTSGLLSMNGPQHKQHRRIVKGPFQKTSITGFHADIVQMTRDMLDGWKPGETRDISSEMTQFMLRMTSGLLFGVDVPETAYLLGDMIDRWVHLNHNTGMGVFVADPSYHDKYDELLAYSEKLEREIRRLIELRRTGIAFGESSNDVLSLLLRAAEFDGHVSDDELVGHVALMFAAAHLTTAHSFTWALFLLAQHPSVMRELHDELQDEIADDAPRLDELNGLPMLDRVLKESMRILPASGYSQRICAEPTQLGPFSLKRGAGVIFSQFITHHMPDLYPEPECFQPDRWLNLAPSPYEYLPYGAGPRMCIGGPLASLILKTGLATILKRYRLTVVPHAHINGKIISTMLGPTTPIPMTIHQSDGRFECVPVQGNIESLVTLTEIPSPAEFRRAA